MKSIRTILSCSRVRLLNIQPVHRSIALHRPCPVKHTNPFSAVTQSSPIAAEQRNIDNDHGELDLDSLFKDITPTYEEERHYDGDRNSYASNFNFSGVDYSEKEDFERNFYEEHPDCAQRDPAEIDEFYQRNGIKVSGVNRPNPILDFSEISFTDYINSKLLKSGFKVPTAIQSISWPATLAGNDVVGIAQTGSGKTLSFILPALIHIQAQRPLQRGEGPIALVLCPTRELAVQCEKVSQRFAGKVRTCSVYGGASRYAQLEGISHCAEIVVATPGRLMDFLQSGEMNLRRCTYLVLDEADRMLDMGFEPQIRKIIDQIRPDRQVTMWSATWPTEIRKLAEHYLTPENVVSIKVGSAELQANENIQQKFVVCYSNDKSARFKDILVGLKKRNDSGDRRPTFPKTLVFCNKKATCDWLSHALRNAGLRSSAIHGDKSQNQRDIVLRDFRSGRTSILIATDVAARGLDIEDIQNVINYDMPTKCTDYVHRIGRTGRAGKQGFSYGFITEGDGPIIDDLISSLKVIGHDVDPQLYKMQQWYRQNKSKATTRPRSTRRYEGDGNRYNRPEQRYRNDYGGNYRNNNRDDNQYNRRQRKYEEYDDYLD